MILYVVFLVLNLLGMGFLFYAYEKQREINTEFLKHAFMANVIMQTLKEELDKAEERITKLEVETNKTEK